MGFYSEPCGKSWGWFRFRPAGGSRQRGYMTIVGLPGRERVGEEVLMDVRIWEGRWEVLLHSILAFLITSPFWSPHLSLACILEERDRQVCPLQIGTCIFCICRDEAARVEAGLATVSSLSPTLAFGTSRDASLFPIWSAGFLPLGRHYASPPLLINKHLVFLSTLSFSHLTPFLQSLCHVSFQTLTSHLPGYSRFLTSLPKGFRSTLLVTSASHAHLEIWLILPKHNLQNTNPTPLPSNFSLAHHCR